MYGELQRIMGNNPGIVGNLVELQRIMGNLWNCNDYW